MPKAVLEFDLEKPEDRDEFKRAQKASDLINVISEFNEESLRKRIKYLSEGFTKKEIELLNKLREELWDLVQEKGCSEIID